MSILQDSSRGVRPTPVGRTVARALAGIALAAFAVVASAAAPQSPGTHGHQAAPRLPAIAAAGESAAAPVRHGRIRLATGVEIHVAEAGPADGQPVLLLHGYTDSWYSWARVIEHLPAGVRAIMPTQRGHGDSERPECCYRLADLAADVVALLDALGIDRADVVGHSMGSLVAQRLAIDRPERVNRLVLVGSGTTAHTEVVLAFYDAVTQLSDPVDPAFARDFQASTVAIPLPPAFFDAIVTESGKLPARVWRDVLGGLIAPEAANDLSRVRAPTLIVWGARDGMFDRAQQDALQRAIAGARLVVYPEAGHSPTWEVPERFVEDMMAFLAGDDALLRAPDRFLDRPDAMLRYRDLGGAGEPVVLLHGYTNRLEGWKGVADSLRHSHRVIALDLRGFGRSRVRHVPATYGKAMALDVVALLDTLGIERAHLVGFSLGALVATTVGHMAPARVESLTLLAPPMFPDSATGSRAFGPFVEALGNGRGVRPFFRWIYPDAPDAAIDRSAARADAANDRTVLIEVLRQMSALIPDSAALRTIAAPTLVAVGTADPFVEHGRYSARQLRAARLALLQDGDHAATMTTPSWVASFRDPAACGSAGAGRGRPEGMPEAWRVCWLLR